MCLIDALQQQVSQGFRRYLDLPGGAWTMLQAWLQAVEHAASATSGGITHTLGQDS